MVLETRKDKNTNVENELIKSPCFGLPPAEALACLKAELKNPDTVPDATGGIDEELQDFLDGLGQELQLDKKGSGGKFGKEIEALLAELDTLGGGTGKGSKRLDTLNSQIDGILLEIQALQRGGLPLLDKQTAKQLNNILNNRLAQADFSFESDQAALLSRLFGRNINRSTIAATASTELVRGQQLIRQQIISDDSAARLTLRENLRDFQLASLQTQANIITNEQQIALGLMQIESNEFIAIRGQTVQLLSTYINADVTFASAALQANTQLQIAEIDAVLRGFGLNLQQQSLDLTKIDNERNYKLALQNLDLRRRELALAERAQRSRAKRGLFGAIAGLAIGIAGIAAAPATGGASIAAAAAATGAIAAA